MHLRSPGGERHWIRISVTMKKGTMKYIFPLLLSAMWQTRCVLPRNAMGKLVKSEVKNLFV